MPSIRCPHAVSACLAVSCWSASAQVLTHADLTPQDAQSGLLWSAAVVQVSTDLAISRSAAFGPTSGEADSAEIGRLNRYLAVAGATSAFPLLTEIPKDPDLASRLGLDRMYLIGLDGSRIDSTEFSDELNTSFGFAVRHAEPVRVGTLTRNDSHSPNDPGFPF